MKILIINTSQNPLHNVTSKHLKEIKKVNPKAIVKLTTPGDESLKSEIKTSEVVITQNLAVVDLNQAEQLKWIHLTSAGVNNLSKELIESEIVISNSSGVHPIPISEHVLGQMLMLTRSMHKSLRNQINKKWVRGEGLLPIDELAGKNVVVVGMGNIGERIAMLCKAFEMKVSGVVRNPDQKRKFVDQLYGSNDLSKAVKNAEFVINCLPGTPETKHIFNATLFKNFKKGSFFINIGRGTTVNENDLIKVLKDGTLTGAGLDVFETEPLPEESKLWDLENVIITPHYSGWNPNYTDRMIEIFCDNLKAFLGKKKMPTLIDKKLSY